MHFHGSNQLYIFQHKERFVQYLSMDIKHKTVSLYKFCGLCLCALMCVICAAAESHSVKAINYSWCSERWTQEDSYPSAPYFMVREHYVQHSEGIHHSAMRDLSSGSLENISGKYLSVHERLCVCLCVCVLQGLSLHSSLLSVCLCECVSSMTLTKATCHVAITQTFPNSTPHS